VIDRGKDLAGKLVLVTGGAKGVGKAIAAKFAARGADVLINFFHSLDAAKETEAELRASGARVECIRASIARHDQVERMFDQIQHRYGYLDILVNNAAAGAFVSMDEVNEEYFDRALDTNLKGAFWCSRFAARLMIPRGGGIIVNLSSLGSHLTVPDYLVVGTSKAAAESLTRYLAAEYGRFNIRVNGASAGMVDTDVVRNFPRYAEMRKNAEERTPIGRLATPDDLADVVMFLASDDSRWILGQTILADGGMSLTAFSLPPLPPDREAAASGVNPAGARDPSSLPAVTSVADRPAEPQPGERVAVVGIGVVLPGASNPEEYWRILLEGPDLFTPPPADRCNRSAFYTPDATAEDKSYSPCSAWITSFTPDPRLPLAMPSAEYDASALWLRAALFQALDGVRHKPADRFSAVVGYTPDGSQHLEESFVVRGMIDNFSHVLQTIAGEPADKQAFFDRIRATLHARYPRAERSPARFLAHRVAHDAVDGILPAATEVLMLDTACSSSLYAVDVGIKGLLMGKHDVAVCGGSFCLAPLNSVLFAKLGGLSRAGAPRPFDENCDGVLFADGAGVVVLKRLERALADGDRILATIEAFGCSSDGKGKAIYAPNAGGQELALRRARAHPAYSATPDWIVAHGTGTPAGDRTEFEALKNTFTSERPIFLNSNKAVIGHTGWTAGVASVIEIVLGLQKQTIPPHHRFDRPPATIQIENTSFVIPRAPKPWPRRDDGPRIAATSSFGFGGTNAHLLLSDFVAGLAGPPPPARPYDEKIVMVAWAAHLPGLSEASDVARWLTGEGRQPGLSFGELYEPPAFERVRLPPRTIRTIDRCQLMVLECAHSLRAELGEAWDRLREKTGVFLGHMGKTGHAILYGNRCYLDDVEQALRANSDLRASAMLEPALGALRHRVRKFVPPANEDSFPGVMPNVIPARVASFFDLRGPTMAIDTGFSSALASCEAAMRYLLSGDVELAVVGGINGNSTAEMQAALEDMPGTRGNLAEGVVLFALTRESTAREHGLPVVAELGEVVPAFVPAGAGHGDSDYGQQRSVIPGRNYLAAEGALAMLKAIQSRQSTATIVCRNDVGNADLRLDLSLPGRGVIQADRLPAQTVVPEQYYSASEFAPGRPPLVQRYLMTTDEFPAEQVREETPYLPARTVVITNQPAVVEALDWQGPDPFILSTAPLTSPRPRWRHLPRITSEAVAEALSAAGPIAHVRVITDLGATIDPSRLDSADPGPLLALHDLTFLVVKHCFDALGEAASSFVALFLNAFADGVPHPCAGLFSGLVKTINLERHQRLVAAVFTSAADPRTGVREAQAETRARRLMPVVFYDRGVRKTSLVHQTTAALPERAPARIDRSSVVVAMAGGRGITAEIAKRLARDFQPRLYLVGSNPIDDYPKEIFEKSDAEFARWRPQYIQRQRAAFPTRSIGQITREFDRMINARMTRRNVDEIGRYCGDRVRYVACSVLDGPKLEDVMAGIVRAEGRIDLLIHAPGINRAASIPQKSLEDFQSVRDLKVRGYLNLKAALSRFPPRMWCNFGSIIGISGQSGECDYASGNDFLNSAAVFARAQGADEFTIGWSVWDEAGVLTSHPLFASMVRDSGYYTPISTEEGLHHFMRELNLPQHDACVVSVGPNERAAISKYVGDVFDQPRPVARRAPAAPRSSADANRPYLGPVLRSSDTEIVFQRDFDLETDWYLRHHVVNGHATLPGTFVPEVAAEAASALVPDLMVTAFENAVFHHYLRIYGTAKAAKRIHAAVVHRALDRAIVKVRILTDIVAPNGTVLSRDRLHSEIDVHLHRSMSPAPLWPAWDAEGETPIPDPYHLPSSPVLLTDLFVSTADTRLHPMGKRATYRPIDPVPAPVSSFLIPSLMLDGLARTAVVALVEADYLPVVAPVRFRRVDLYERGNDADFATRYERIDLYTTSAGSGAGPYETANRCIAVRPDGRAVLEIKGISGTVTGYLHRGTGQFLSIDEMRSLKAERALLRVRSETIAPPPPIVSADGGVGPVERMVARPLRLPPLPEKLPHLAHRTIVVSGGTEQAAAGIIRTLSDCGALAVRFDPGSREPGQAALDLRGRLSRIDGIVDLNLTGLGAFKADDRSWEQAVRQSVALVKACYEDWAQETDASRVFYVAVTAMGGQMGYGKGVAQPLGGIWAGFAKTLPRELPNCNIKIVDLGPADLVHADQIVVRELGLWDLFELGYRDGIRHGLFTAEDDVPSPTLSLGPEDTVLISGGGRGVGFALATALARNFGSRVVVTGRSPLPVASEPWCTMDDEEFAAYTRGLYGALGEGQTLLSVRSHIERLKQDRERLRNLAGVIGEGLPVEYHACDFNVAEQVQALVNRLGAKLTVVVHNAAVDTPVRLASKSLDSFVGTLGVKVHGFLHLARALSDRPLKLFCNVGSLTGRMGGMAGQTDYGAGNDAIARLGFWAVETLGLPVKTICWPTWENLGLIHNFGAAVKYMSAVNVPTGLYHWQRELLAGGTGEVCFVGRPGRARVPNEMPGFHLVSARFPELHRLSTRYHYMGEVLRFRPFHTLNTRHRLDPALTPALTDFSVGTAPALPVSLLLEYAIAAGEWVPPEGWPEVHLTEIRGTSINLSALHAAPDGSVAFERDARASRVDEQWVVDVTCARVDGQAREVMATLRLAYSEQPSAAGDVVSLAGDPGQPAPLAVGDLAWNGRVFGEGRWMDRGPARIGVVTACGSADLWMTHYDPALVLGPSHIEACLRAALSRHEPPRADGHIAIDRITVTPAPSHAWHAVVTDATGDLWSFVDVEGRTLARVEGVRVNAPLSANALEQAT
jgi:NAD(P)-dependent dehydrogenase (short-subunit alcohol dehydrogenase family)/3-oxoacyl-(acyl-carrier-protein) synthase